MIEVKNLEITEYRDGMPYKADIKAVADTKSEVVPGAKFIGLPEGCSINLGSSISTPNLDIGIMRSDGTWNWI